MKKQPQILVEKTDAFTSSLRIHVMHRVPTFPQWQNSMIFPYFQGLFFFFFFLRISKYNYLVFFFFKYGLCVLKFEFPHLHSRLYPRHKCTTMSNIKAPSLTNEAYKEKHRVTIPCKWSFVLWKAYMQKITWLKTIIGFYIKLKKMKGDSPFARM